MTGFFIIGTDTGVGKTVATCQLLRAFNVAGKTAVGMKPVAAGCKEYDGCLWNEDVAAHAAASSLKVPVERACPYLFACATSPHLAAQRAGSVIDLNHLLGCAADLQALADVVLIEGAGGWHTPLNDTADMSDLAFALEVPVILVVGIRLGCLNHAILTADAIDQKGLMLAGWIANQIDPTFSDYQDNLVWLQKQLCAPLLSQIAYSPDAARGVIPPGVVEQL